MLNTDKDAPLAHSSSHGKNAGMVLNTDQHMDSNCDDDNIVDTGEKIPIHYTMKMCHQLIAGLNVHVSLSNRIWQFTQRETA